MTVDALAAAAALRGASGVRSYLLENRATLRELLASLASLTLLKASSSVETDTAGPVKVGLCIEALPVLVQRELWSAFVLWHTVLPADALGDLVETFLSTAVKHALQSTPADTVSVSLAEQLQQYLQEEEHDDHGRDDGEESTDPADAIGARLQELVFLPSLPEVTRAHDTAPARKRRRETQDDPAPDTVLLPQEVERTEPEPSAQTVTLPAEVESRLNAIGAQLVVLGSPDAPADQSSRALELASLAADLLRHVMNQVHATQQDNEALFHVACVKLQLSLTSDDVLFRITNSLMDANWSSRYAAIYLDTAVLPRVLRATSVISRVLLQTILLYARPSYTSALTDGLLVPLLSTPSIGPSQGEAATRLLREKCVPIEHIDTLLRRSLEPRHPTLLTNEATILVFQNTLNMKPLLSASTIELLVSAAAVALDHDSTRESLRKSPKFASLVFTLVTKYGAQCSAHVEELQGVASQLTSVMAKSALRAIQKLKS